MNIKRILVLVMALVMVASACAPAALALTQSDYEDVIETYLQNVEKEDVDAAVEFVINDLSQNYEEYYAMGYAYALENGYIDMATEYIERAIETIKNIDYDSEAVKAELDQIVATLEKLLAILKNEVIESYQAFVEALNTLKGEVEAHINNFIEISKREALEFVEEIILPVLYEVRYVIETVVDPIVDFVIQQMLYFYDRLVYTVNVARETYFAIVRTIVRINAFAKETYDRLVAFLQTGVNGNYELKDESFYLALGEAVYSEDLAGKLNLGDKYHQSGLDEDYLEILSKSDLVTVKFDNGEFINILSAQVIGVIAGIVREHQDIMNWYNRIEGIDNTFGTNIKSEIDNLIDINATTIDLDWSKYVGEEEHAQIKEALADLRADLIENGVPEYYDYDINPLLKQILEDNGLGGIFKLSFNPLVIPVADLVVLSAETALYGYAEFTSDIFEILDNVSTYAPEATVVLSGLSNPLADLDLFGIDLSKYSEALDVVVGALNAQLYVTALAYENVVFVADQDADSIYDALNVHCDHVYDDCLDTECARCLENRVSEGHSFTNYVSNKDAKCTTDGTETAKCDYCDATDKRVAVGSALGHDWKGATCTSPKTCKTCNVKEGGVIDHEMGEWKVAVDPTSSTQGREDQKCLHCDYTISRPLDNTPLSTGAIIAIIIACVAVIGGASAGVALWRNKKSK